MALTDKLTAIANAIRAKTGKTESLTLDQMPTEIESITTGGGSSADCCYVTFRNEATGEEFVKPVATGDDCVDVVAKGLWAKPTKPSDAQYDYTFYGWGASDGGAADANILKNITEDKTVYAIFSKTLRTYTITWLDDDGSELKSEPWAYGTVPSYAPTKDGVVFNSWSPTPVAVTGDTSYTAVWAELPAILKSTSITTASSTSSGPTGSATNDSGVVAAVGDTFRVIWNGVSYTVTAKKIAFYYTNVWEENIGIGNPYCVTKYSGKACTKRRNDSQNGTDATDTGEPFWIKIEAGWFWIKTKAETTATLAIYQE